MTVIGLRVTPILMFFTNFDARAASFVRKTFGQNVVTNVILTFH